MTPADATREPTPEEIELLAAGSLTVEGAQEFSGLSRNELWDRMDDGTLDWWPHGSQGRRFIVRKSLARYLATLFANRPEKPAKRRCPNPHAKPQPVRLHSPGSRAGTPTRKDSR